MDYKKLNEMLNDYAVDTIYEIMDKYENILTDEQKDLLSNKIANNKVVEVNALNENIINKFEGNVPSASGPRSFGDGIIHIFPYKYENLSIDEIVDLYKKEGIITHELYHFLIKMDLGIEEQLESDFGHYLTEGMVELFTEIHMGSKIPSSGYRKNVDLASKIIDELPKDKLDKIFSMNWKQISDNVLDLNKYFEYYKSETEFLNNFKIFLDKVSKSINIPASSLFNAYKSCTLEETITDVQSQIYKYYQGEDAESLNQEFMEMVDKVIKQENNKSLS